MVALAAGSEYFKFTRDSRVVTMAFTYRFGKTFQSRKFSNAATEEMNRAAGGNSYYSVHELRESVSSSPIRSVHERLQEVF